MIWALAGCVMEQSLGVIAPERADDAHDDAQQAAADAPSPWDDLAVGNLPETALLAVWDDVTDVPLVDEPTDAFPCRPGPTQWLAAHGQPRLGLVDLRGRLIGEVPMPARLDPHAEPELQALGPTTAWLLGRLDQEHRRAWAIDAAALTTRERVAWDVDGGVVAVTVDGGAWDLPAGIADLHPTVVGDTVVVALEHAGAAAPPPADTPVLISFPADADPVVWTVADLVPAGVPTGWFVVSHLAAARGELVVQASVEGAPWDDPAGPVAWRDLRLVLDPATDARRWVIDVDGLDTAQPPIHRHTDADRGALFTESPYAVDVPGLVVHDSARPATHIDADGACVAGQLLLDAAAPTVVYRRHGDGDDYGTALVVNHHGVDVWTIDGLKVGLGERRAYVRALATLE